jgi:rRNA processing protein Krr1/Pno1
MSEEEASRKREREEDASPEDAAITKQSKTDPETASTGDAETKEPSNAGADAPASGEEEPAKEKPVDSNPEEGGKGTEESTVPAEQTTTALDPSASANDPPAPQDEPEKEGEKNDDPATDPAPAPQESEPAAPPQNTEVVAGTTETAPGTAPPVASGEAQEGAQPSPSTLAPPPEAVTDPEAIVEEKGEVSAYIAGRVIGKGGEVIRDLQARSGASIDVEQAPVGSNRIVTYRGPRRKVDFAKHLVDLISNGVSDTDLPLGEAIREVLLIPASSTGKVIGRGGEMVREMQSRSQAKIDFDHTAMPDRPDQKKVVVTGTADAVRKANEMIMFLVANPLVEAMQSLHLLVNEKLASGQPWGSGPPYPGLPNAGSNMQPEMLGSYGIPGGYGPDAQYTSAPPAYTQAASNPRFGGSMSSVGGMAEEMFFAKKHFMGRIIGQKGVTINDLQKRSGADIQINQQVPAGQDCEIRIRGSPQGIEMAKQMLREIIEVGPAHPYAGGAGGASAGYGNYQAAAGGGAYGWQQQQQQQPAAYGAYGYTPQAGAGAYGAATQPTAYPSYGGYPGQDYGGYAAAPAAYGGSAPSYGNVGGYSAARTGFSASNYGQSAGYPQQQAPAPAPLQAYGAGAYGQPPPSYPPAPAPPSAWKAATSPDGQTYYYNPQTGETSWNKPPGMP